VVRILVDLVKLVIRELGSTNENLSDLRIAVRRERLEAKDSHKDRLWLNFIRVVGL
jgi:hypothetical protein